MRPQMKAKRWDMNEKELSTVIIDQQQLEKRLLQQRQAYTFLRKGAEQLLGLNALFWTE